MLQRFKEVLIDRLVKIKRDNNTNTSTILDQINQAGTFQSLYQVVDHVIITAAASDMKDCKMEQNETVQKWAKRMDGIIVEAREILEEARRNPKYPNLIPPVLTEIKTAGATYNYSELHTLRASSTKATQNSESQYPGLRSEATTPNPNPNPNPDSEAQKQKEKKQNSPQNDDIKKNKKYDIKKILFVCLGATALGLCGFYLYRNSNILPMKNIMPKIKAYVVDKAQTVSR